MPAALTMEQKKEKADAKATIRNTIQRGSTARRNAFNGTQTKLGVGNQIEGYHLHIFNDSPGRIDQALQAGYEFVSPDEVGGTATNVVSRNTDIGDKVRFLVGTDANNQPQYAYLMKIRNEFYEEDQNNLQARNDAIDTAIKGGKLTKEGMTPEGFYEPKGGIKLSRS
jgi:hypothetical protein